jgi:hypothetical protein
LASNLIAAINQKNAAESTIAAGGCIGGLPNWMRNDISQRRTE